MANAKQTREEQAAAKALKAAELMPRVRRIAWAIARQLPSHIDRDDLLGAAYLGLAEALNKLGPSEEPTFEAYALRRTRGAIADQLRSYDVLTRTERAKLQRLTAVARKLSTELGRKATDDEVAAAAGMSEADCAKVMAAAARRTTQPVPEPDTGADEPAVRDSIRPDALLSERRELDSLNDGVARLPARLRSVIDLYYNRDLTLRQIGKELGVSEARAYQLREIALEELRDTTQAA